MVHGARSIRFTTLRLTAVTLVVGFASFAAVALTAHVAAAATDVVTTYAGSGPGSLPSVVAAAASGDTITFSVSCPLSSPITLASTIDINVNLTIDGPGASDVAVSGNNSVEVFDVASAVAATISGLTIEDGNASPGAGVTNNGTVTIENSRLLNSSGGGIYSTGGVNVVNSTVSGNNGGGIVISSTGSSGELNLTNSSVSDNKGLSYGGGITNEEGNVTITNSAVSSNTADIFGGGISNSGGTTSITASTISGNGVAGGPGFEAGGGIYNTGTLIASDSTISGNSVSEVQYDDGGGIYSTGTSTVTTVSNSTIFGNKVIGGIEGQGGGGGIYNGGGILTVDSSTISGNSTSGSPGFVGGGIDGGATFAATVLAGNAGGDCSSATADDGYNLDDDASCGFSAANNSQSDVDPDLGPLQNNGGPTETQAPSLGSPVLNRIPVGTTANGVTLCPGTDQRGISRPQGSECDIGAVELVIPQAITSPNNATATAGSPFSFTVDTSGNPVPTITEKGTLPRHLTFTDNHNGTATLSGTPKTAGVTHLTIKATFGRGTTKYVVRQAFTLTVDSGKS